MKNYLKIIGILVIIFFLINSCKNIKGKGISITQSRSLSVYHGIILQIEGDVQVVDDSVNSFIISAQQNIIDVIETNIDNDILTIKYKKNVHIHKHNPISIEIHSPLLSKYDIEGSGDINITPPNSKINIDLNISGSGNIKFNSFISTSTINANISGSGSILFCGGTADSETLSIAGSGNIDMRNVLTGVCSSTISGSGDIYTNVVTSLSATISGSGNIYYYGNPVVSVNISGSGNVIHL